MIGSTEILVIAVVVLVLFGSTALPKFARSLGEAKKEFAKAGKESEEIKAGMASSKETEKLQSKS